MASIVGRKWIVAVLGTIVAIDLALGGWYFFVRERPVQPAEVFVQFEPGRDYGGLSIRYPFAESVFPPEMPPPVFLWEDRSGRADAWAVRVECEDGAGPLYFESGESQWAPSEVEWTAIRDRCLGGRAEATIVGVNRSNPQEVLSAARLPFRISAEEVAAPIFYREVNLPFIDAVKDPSRIRWRFGSVSSRQPPPIVLENLPVCGNCHSFSKDGATLGLDVDYANDKGSYAILPVDRWMVLDRGKMMTWSNFRPEEGEPTFGLLSAVSPDGQHVVSTVKDRSVFVPTADLAYSQLFFPVKGILAVYSRQTGEIRALPGADDPQYVQSNAAWSPDGKYLVFARSKAYALRKARGSEVLMSPEDCAEFLSKEKTLQFDLYRIPFNGGQGGKPEPLRGASGNGMSNYFPKFSPDGKWIVFCRAKNFMLLQPDSELYIVPAEGGQERRLACNLPGMNSWHSWSPNGRWLVFSSKVFTPYTQLFLAHVDERGQSAPPVLLAQFTAPDRAANIPEFVPAAADAIQGIAAEFVDDYNYALAARRNLLANDIDAAEAACRKALQINPQSPEALSNMGIVFFRRGKPDEAIAHFRRALQYGPEDVDARVNLGNALAQQGKREESLVQFREALRINPDLFAARLPLGVNLIRLGRPEESLEHLAAAVKLDPNDGSAEYYLGLACQRLGRFDQAIAHYAAALQHQPDFVDALLGLAAVRSEAPPPLRDLAEAIRLATRACQLTQSADVEPLAVLAKAYAAANRLEEAVLAAQQAVDAARKTGNPALIRTVQERFDEYCRKARK